MEVFHTTLNIFSLSLFYTDRVVPGRPLTAVPLHHGPDPQYLGRHFPQDLENPLRETARGRWPHFSKNLE